MKKRILSFLLALVMVLSLVPTAVWAEGHDGQVHVIVENSTYSKAKGAPWDGTLVDKWIDLDSESTMMSCVEKAVESVGSKAKVNETQYGAYLASIDGLGEFSGSEAGGWMGTLNDWFVNESFANFSVKNGKLAENDEIHVMFTMDMGADIGGDFESTDRSLKSLSFGAGELSPAFTSDTYAYTLTVPADTASVTVDAVAVNKNYQVHTTVDSTEYKRNADLPVIPVSNGTVITVTCCDVGYDSNVEDSGEAKVYTVTVAVEGADPDVTTAKVTVRSQMYGGYLHSVSAIDVPSNAAESYGLSDEVNGVSALDALVKAHELIYDDFSKDTLSTYLNVSSTGWISTIFGVTTYASGFFVNEGYPNDGTPSSYGSGYNGTFVTNTALTDGDVVDFFVYEDEEAYSDYYTWIDAPASAMDGSTISVTVKGFYTSSAYLYATPAALKAAAKPVEGLQLAWLDPATGAVTAIENAITDENGAASVTVDAAAATGYLVAASYGDADKDERVYALMNPSAQINVISTEPVIIDGLHSAQLDSLKIYTYTDGVKGDIDLLDGVEAIATNDYGAKKYETKLPAGDYLVEGYDANKDTCNGTIVITVVKGENTFTLSRAYQIYATNSGWVEGTDYTVSVKVTGTDGTVRQVQTGKATSYGTQYTTCLFMSGDTVAATLTPIGEKAADYLPLVVSKSGSQTTNQAISLSGSVPQALGVTVTAPGGSTIDMGTFGSYYSYTFIDPETTTENPDSNTVTAVFRVPSTNLNHFVRVQNPDGVTYWTFGKYTDGKEIEVTREDLHLDDSVSKDTVYRFNHNVYDLGNIYLTVNRQGYLPMSEGETRELDVFRNWQAIETAMNAQIALPDVHYKVVNFDGSDSDVVTITPDEKNSALATISANKSGTAIVLVTYDAMTHAQAMGGTSSKVLSAIWPEFTGVFVVSVGADGSSIQTNTFLDRLDATISKDEQKYLDAEHDILFYLGSEGASYSFTPESGTTVTVARSTVGSTMTFNGFTSAGVTTDANGQVTVSGLTTGRHIIRVEKNGLATYQVVTARGVSYDLLDADGNILPDTTELNPGDTVTVQFHDLVSPREKLAGVNNFNFSLYYLDADGTVFKSNPGTPFGQYDFSGNAARQKFDITIPANAEGYTYTLTGAIKVGGFAGVPTHRGISYTTGIDRQYGTNPAINLSQLPELTLKLTGYAENQAVLRVQELIAAIGTVTLDSKSAIDTARTAYDALNEMQQAKVSNYDVLTAAEAELARLEKAAVDSVKALIDAIGDDITLSSEKAITDARTAFTALRSDLQAQVDNLSKLTAAENQLAKLKQEVKDVEDAIYAIDDDVTLESEPEIIAAREAYNALTEEQQDTVSNYPILVAAETRIAELKVGNIYKTTGDYIANQGTPGFGSMGGEWAALGLARSGRTVPGGESYYNTVVKSINETIDANGRLDPNKPTENARVILALTAIGKDVTNVDGHNLLQGLDSMAFVKKQSVNGPVWTLLALDSHNYTPLGDVTREALVDAILATQRSDGSWPVMASKKYADVDMTAMAVQALAPYYKTNARVKTAVDSALAFLSDAQNANGSYSENVGGTASLESGAQVVVALCALGLDPDNDSRFIKNGVSVLDAMINFYVTGGGFRHVMTGDINTMATEQGYYALAAYFRMMNGKTFLYDMTDICDVGKHTGNWTVTREATCTQDGSRTRTCTTCGIVETQVIAKLGHKAGNTFSMNELYHWNTCIRCGLEMNKAKHSFYLDQCITCGYRNNCTRLVFDAVTVPDDLKDNDKLNTPEKIIQHMNTRIVAKDSRYTAANTLVMDVRLEIQNADGTWREATAEDMAAAGKIDVLLPYPAGINSTNYTKYDFLVTHMFTSAVNGKTPGDVEFPAVTKTANGLYVTLTGLSPVAISYTVHTDSNDPAPTPTPGTTTGGTGSGDKVTSSNTGDSSQMTLWIGTVILSGAAITLLLQKKKRQSR